MRRFAFYEVKRGDNLADRQFWNDRFLDVDLRFAAVEEQSERIDAAVDQITTVALQRLNDTFTPVVNEAISRLASVGVLFTADSLSTATIDTDAGKSFVIEAGQRDSYAVSEYVSVRPRGFTDRGMLCAVDDYERATGLLTVSPIGAAYVAGSGQYSDWTIRIAVAPSLGTYSSSETDALLVPINSSIDALETSVAAHAANTANPHGTTAAQVGAYTMAAADAATSSAVSALSTTVNTSLANRVRFDASQSLTTAQQRQAQTNIAAQKLHGIGQCYLRKSGSNLLLAPQNGNLLMINGALETIPDAGVTLAATGLTVAFIYQIYAFMNGSTMTLEASSVGHSTQAGTGVEIKTGDPTRTLVGKAMPMTGPAWVDTWQQRFVISWFNRQPLLLRKDWTTNPSTTSGVPVELDTASRLEFLCWANSMLQFNWFGFVGQQLADAKSYTLIGLDGTSNISPQQPVWFINGSSTNFFPVAMSSVFDNQYGLTENYHYANVFGMVSSGTGNWGFGGVSRYPSSSAVLYL